MRVSLHNHVKYTNLSQHRILICTGSTSTKLHFSNNRWIDEIDRVQRRLLSRRDHLLLVYVYAESMDVRLYPPRSFKRTCENDIFLIRSRLRNRQVFLSSGFNYFARHPSFEIGRHFGNSTINALLCYSIVASHQDTLGSDLT